ncbi:hypothetical protein V2J09_020167 [Rumex salicifolius]
MKIDSSVVLFFGIAFFMRDIAIYFPYSFLNCSVVFSVFFSLVPDECCGLECTMNHNSITTLLLKLKDAVERMSATQLSRRLQRGYYFKFARYSFLVEIIRESTVLMKDLS